MPGYVKAALLKFQHEATQKNQYDPHRWNQRMYDVKNQYADTDREKLVYA